MEAAFEPATIELSGIGNAIVTESKLRLCITLMSRCSLDVRPAQECDEEARHGREKKDSRQIDEKSESRIAVQSEKSQTGEESRCEKRRKRKRRSRQSRKAGKDGGAAGLDKSVEQFRESLEHSVTLSRDRLQEVVDDAVKRGRITRGDAEKMLSDLVKRGRRQTDTLLKELERLVSQARKEVGGRTEPVRKQATQAARRARKKLS